MQCVEKGKFPIFCMCERELHHNEVAEYLGERKHLYEKLSLDYFVATHSSECMYASYLLLVTNWFGSFVGGAKAQIARELLSLHVVVTTVEPAGQNSA